MDTKESKTQILGVKNYKVYEECISIRKIDKNFWHFHHFIFPILNDL